jgi:hypothetical protein
MTAFTLMFALYTGGIIATIGFMFAGMRQDNNIKGAGLFTYLYAFTCCVAWPWTIIEQIRGKEEV